MVIKYGFELGCEILKIPFAQERSQSTLKKEKLGEIKK